MPRPMNEVVALICNTFVVVVVAVAAATAAPFHFENAANICLGALFASLLYFCFIVCAYLWVVSVQLDLGYCAFLV